jgi:hypothetical protein
VISPALEACQTGWMVGKDAPGLRAGVNTPLRWWTRPFQWRDAYCVASLWRDTQVAQRAWQGGYIAGGGR